MKYYHVTVFSGFLLKEKRLEGMKEKKKMEAEMQEAGEIIKARKEEKLAKMTPLSR